MQIIRIIKKFNNILDFRQKNRIGIIIFMMLVGAVMETMGVSMVLPLITTILNDEFYKTNQYAVRFCRIFDIESSQTFVIVLLTIMILIFIFKDLYLLLEYYIQQRFISNNRVALQRKILHVTLQREYEYFLNESTGNIMRTIINDVEGTYTLLTGIIDFMTEMIISLVLLVAIMIMDLRMAVFVVCVLGLEMLAIIKCFRPKMLYYGKVQRGIKASQNKWIMQSVAGIKEIKVGKKEPFFEKKFDHDVTQSALYDRKCKVLQNVPRLVIEAVTISSMLVYMIILLLLGVSVEKILPQLAAFAVAAVRLLPSVNRITSSYNSFAFLEPNIDGLLSNLQFIKEVQGLDVNSRRKKQRENHIPSITLQKSCGLSDLTYGYKGSSKCVLSGANMDIPVGKTVGIIGTSGTGKTTAVDILLGLLKPQKGTVYADGNNIFDNYSSWLDNVSYIPQSVYMLDDTIAANVAFGLEKDEVDEAKVWRALEDAQLSDFVKTLPMGIDTEIGERGMRLSGGQRQRIGIARALYVDSELLIFDEATSALDNETEVAIMGSIKLLQGKKTMIIIAHRLTTVESCDIIYRVCDGKIIGDGKAYVQSCISTS